MKTSRFMCEDRRIRTIAALAILVGSVVIVSCQDPRRTTAQTSEETTYDDDITELATDENINFDLALRAQLQAFKYSDEEPAFAASIEYIDTNVEDWSFAYAGGEAGDKRPPYTRAVTWGIGLIGIDFFEKTYKVTAMSVLITPKILMTLCSNINSYYRSYKGLLFEEQATEELFKISNTSDPQFDIRTPTIIAFWSSKDGFLYKTGDENVMEVSRHILASQSCTEAVEGKHVNQTILQYRTPAFLLLREPISNPMGSDLRAYLPFLSRVTDDDQEVMFRSRDNGYPIEMMAYKQRPCHYPSNITQLTSLKVWRLPQSGEVVEAGLHLLTSQWYEGTNDDGSGVPCDFLHMNRYAAALEAMDQDWAKEYIAAMNASFQKPFVGCFYWHWGNLCDAPPGSPVFYWSRLTEAHPGTDALVALSITSPITIDYEHMSPGVHFMGMMVTHEAHKEQLKNTIREIVDYVDNLGSTREQATDYPTYNKLIETEKILLEVIGNLDGDVVPEVEEKLAKAGIILSKALRVELARFAIPATLIVLILTLKYF